MEKRRRISSGVFQKSLQIKSQEEIEQKCNPSAD
jgi:hypothetical protein